MIKQKNLYLPNGYFDFRAAVDDECPFAFVIGGRATGKTFGALQYGYTDWRDTDRPFVYMRRTAKQAELVSTDVFNPFRPLNTAFGWNVQPFPITKGVYGYFDAEQLDGRSKPTGGHAAVIAALSTFSNFRGFDGSNIDLIIYDEFIKNAGEKSIKDEGESLLNVFETVNRNRELIGGKPVKLVCLSNSNAIANDIFIDLKLMGYVDFMRRHHKNQYYDYGRGIAIYDLSDSEISQRKKQTALYRMDDGSRYSKMALDNEYEDYDSTLIRSCPLSEYKPLASIRGLTIYTHKSDQQYYCTFHSSGKPEIYDSGEIDKTRFLRKYAYLWEAYLGERILFESLTVKKLFEDIFY